MVWQRFSLFFLYYMMKTGFVVVIDVIRLAAAASDMARGHASF